MKVVRIVVLAVVLVLFGTWVYAADCASGGRYEINGYPTPDGTVTDCRTGLVWLRNAKCMDYLNGVPNPTGRLAWHDAMKWVRGLATDYCGLSDSSHSGDWRLPTKTEWMAMLQYAKGRYTNPTLTNGAGTGQWTDDDAFSSVQSSLYWSSTTYIHDETNAYEGNLINGFPNYVGAKTTLRYVWPVRAGQVGGNTTSFDSVTIE